MSSAGSSVVDYCCNSNHCEDEHNGDDIIDKAYLQNVEDVVEQDTTTSVVAASPTVYQRKYKILLADDSTAIRNVLMKILQRGGHEVLAVTNGLEAVQAFEKTLLSLDENDNKNGLFDVIILDLHMPVLDGFEAMKRMRQLENSVVILPKKHLIIGCSANDDQETISEMLLAGANTSLTKPFSLKQFEDCVVEQLVR